MEKILNLNFEKLFTYKKLLQRRLKLRMNQLNACKAHILLDSA